jgi:hypothetical protein
MKYSLGEINRVDTFVVLWFLLPDNSSLYNGLGRGGNVIDNERFKNEFN